MSARLVSLIVVAASMYGCAAPDQTQAPAGTGVSLAPVASPMPATSTTRTAKAMEGQTLTVRIIVAQYLPPPRRSSRYKYEVIDKASTFHGKIDWAESDLDLKQGHTYIVQVNRTQANPRIEAVQDEVKEDLSPYIDALRLLGQASTAQQVADELKRTNGLVVKSDAVRRRLDRLVELGQVQRARDFTVGRPYVYELAPETSE